MNCLNKGEIRKKYIEKRSRFTSSETGSLSQQIADQFFSLSLSGINYLHLFHPLAGKKEVDTLIIADRIRKASPGIKLVLPRSDASDRSLSHILWEQDMPLVMNSWGIVEPQSGITVEAAMLDMILVPLLAFDIRGNRIGYGKGFYDRFLEQCRPDAVKVGLSFFDAEEEGWEAEKTDVRLDVCVTPTMIRRF